MLSSFDPTTGEQVSEQFKALMIGELYEEVAKLGDNIARDDFFECLCPTMTSFAPYKGLFEYLENRKMFTGFLIYGKMSLIRKAIIEVNLDYDKKHIYWGYIRSATILSLKEDRHDRFIDLLEAIRETTAGEDKMREQAEGPTWFNAFMYQFFGNLVPEKNSMPLKRFLAMWGEELGEKYPRLFKTFCLTLVHYLKLWPSYSSRRALLLDLIGQASLIAPIIFARTFLTHGEPYYVSQLDFIIYSCRETIAEGLKEEYPEGGRDLWKVMTETFPDQFYGEYPYSDEARKAVLARFKTKQQMEDECGVEILPKLLGLLKELVPDLPMIPLNRVTKYLIPWIAFTQIPSQRHLVLQTERAGF